MKKTRSWSVVAAAVAALLLSACGGGAELGDGGTTLGGTTGGTTGGDPVGPTVSTLILLASSPTLTSDASDVSAGVTLTVIARDENNNVVPGVTVVFSTPDSAEINVVNPAVTDENGRVTAVVTTGGDPENRRITVTAAAANLSSSVNIDVVGTTLSISGLDSTQINVPTEYTVLLADASGEGIANQTIAVSTDAENSLASESLVTNSTGQVTVTLTAARPDSTLTAEALGLTATKEIAVSTDEFSIEVLLNGQPLAGGPLVPGTDQCSDGTRPPCPPELDIANKNYQLAVTWKQNDVPVQGGAVNFAATRGSITNAAPTTNSSGVATATLSSSESGFSILTASSPDDTKPSISTKVEFIATDPAKIEVQADPASVPPNQSSEITAVVRDEDNNLVKNVTVEFSLSDQTAGVLSSPTAVTNSQGLARITYTSTSQASATEGITITGRVRGTVLQDSANLTVGGRAADITIGTGSQVQIKDSSTYALPFTVIVTDSAGNPVPDADFRLTLFATKYLEGTFEQAVLCDNEDLNRNDILDPGEDNNASGTLEPGRVASLPATIELDDDGAGQFLVTYAKSFGFFIVVEITGVVTVSGTETTEKRSFLLPVAETDVNNLPGISPFGLDLVCETYDPPAT